MRGVREELDQLILETKQLLLMEREESSSLLSKSRSTPLRWLQESNMEMRETPPPSAPLIKQVAEKVVAPVEEKVEAPPEEEEEIDLEPLAITSTPIDERELKRLQKQFPELGIVASTKEVDATVPWLFVVAPKNEMERAFWRNVEKAFLWSARRVKIFFYEGRDIDEEGDLFIEMELLEQFQTTTKLFRLLPTGSSCLTHGEEKKKLMTMYTFQKIDGTSSHR